MIDICLFCNQPPTRYWEGTEEEGKNDGKKQKEGDNNEQTPQQNNTRTKKGGKRGGKRGGAGKRVISGVSGRSIGSTEDS